MSASLAMGRGLDKTTCIECKRTVVMEKLDDGTVVATDTELIAVVVKIGGAGARLPSRTRHNVRRVHSEQCAKYKDEAAREKLDAEKAKWRKEQARKGSKTLVAPELGIAPIVATIPPPPKYVTLAAARKAVLAGYAAVAKFRSKL